MGSLGEQKTPLIDRGSPDPDGVKHEVLHYTDGKEGELQQTSLAGSSEDEEEDDLKDRNFLVRKWLSLFPGGYYQEWKKSMWMSVPLVFVFFTQLIIQPIALLFGGHEGTLQLTALGLANSIISVTANTFFLGMSTACDTLYSQITGFNNMKYLGVMMQRTMAIFWLTTLLVWGLDMNMATLLTAMGQDPVVSKLTGRYVTIFLPAIPCLFLNKVYRNYTIVQGEILSFFVSGAVNVILAIIFNYLFVFPLNFGLDGSAYAQVIAYVATALGYTIFIALRPLYRQAWPGWTWRLFENWGEFTSLAVYGIFMISLEFWAFEISIFLAGLLGPIELGAQSIAYNLDMIFYCIPAGVGTACAIRCGTALGAGNHKEAKCAAYVSLTIIACSSVVTTIMFATLRDYLPLMFSSDPRVVKLCSELLPYVAFYNLFINTSIVMRGVFRGVGKQVVGSVIIIVGYYVMAMPMGVCLMFLTPMRTKGLWLAFCVALSFDTLIYMLYMAFKIDWPTLVIDAKERAARLVIKQQENNERTKLLMRELEGQPINDSDEDHEKGNVAHVDDKGRMVYVKMPIKLKIKRALTVSFIFAIFAACVCCRLFIPIPFVYIPPNSVWAQIIDEALNQTGAV